VLSSPQCAREVLMADFQVIKGLGLRLLVSLSFGRRRESSKSHSGWFVSGWCKILHVAIRLLEIEQELVPCLIIYTSSFAA
jgi:hypothetical protein